MIGFETVSLGTGGVAPCVRCTAESLAPLDFDVILPSLTAAAHMGAGGVILAGTEPFAHPSLVEIIGAARALEVPRIGVQTDGSALALGQNAAGSVSAGVRFFEFVFLGGNAESHDRAVGRSGAFSSLLAGVSAVKRAASPDRRVFVAGVVRLCPHTVGGFVPAVSAAVSAGVRSVRVESTPGLDLPRAAVDQAHAIATTAGVALFGDGCDHLLMGARLYEMSPAKSGSEVAGG